jgi:tetratricopeptide (TPR) repeat protein
MKRTVATMLVAAFVPSWVLAQDPVEIQRLFESGRYQQIVEATTPASPPEVVYTSAHSYQKLGDRDRAIQAYAILAERPDTDWWHFVGLSGRQLLEEQVDACVASAQQAVMMAPQEAMTHFQLGLALAKQQQWAPAAAEFDAAIGIQPTMTYAYYYGGLMHYRARRMDLMGARFDEFLKLAPQASERPEVLSTMRTLRGR